MPVSTTPSHGAAPRVPPRLARALLALEFSVLYVVVPLLLWFERARFGRMIVPTLVVMAVVFVVVLLRDRSFDRRRLGTAGRFRADLPRILRRLLVGSALVTAATWAFEPDLFFRFPRENPRVWAIVMIAYPFFSVYPQEIIFRTFLFHRYRPLFPNETAMVAVSAVTFGLAHVFFANWWAPVLSTVGGWIFARTYARSRSTLLATVDHGLWGDVIFTVGLGWYFYGGAIAG